MNAIAMKYLKRYPSSKRVVLMDFDNTITRFDVLDDIVKRFSADRRWAAVEKAWKEGRIGSKECLEGQLCPIKMTKLRLSRYLSKVRIDPHFKRLLSLFRKKGTRAVIVSDSFSFIIRRILDAHGLGGLKVYSNAMRFNKDRISLIFPHRNARCHRCGNCKKMHLSKYRNRGNMIIYIGDGLSDLCPAEHAEVVFAKGTLLKSLRKKKKRCIGFKNLGDVYKFFRKEIRADVRKTEDT